MSQRLVRLESAGNGSETPSPTGADSEPGPEADVRARWAVSPAPDYSGGRCSLSRVNSSRVDRTYSTREAAADLVSSLLTRMDVKLAVRAPKSPIPPIIST